MSSRAVFVFLIVALIASGCSGVGQAGVPELPTGDAQRGRMLFSQASIRDTSGCVQCHSLARYKVIVGPSLWGVETRAERIIHAPDYHGTATTAEQYLRESITRPDVYVSAGFAHSVMPDWLTVLDEQQIQDLVAYLMTLKE
jgi:mono/diheme cytochrome c family protein